MKIKNIDGLTNHEIRSLINEGGKFIIYPYSISIIFMSFKRFSDIYLIKPNEKATQYGTQYILASLVLGWWGIPWGPIYTIGSIYTALKGGNDVTFEIMSEINNSDPNYGTQNQYNISGNDNVYNIPK
jgi:hypothetical protein